MRNSIALCTGFALALCACGAAQDTDVTSTDTAAVEEPATPVVIRSAQVAPPIARAPAPPAGIPPEPLLGGPRGPSARPSPSERLDDGEIGELLDTVDDAEIAIGELIMQRSQDPAVKELAASLVKEHKKTNQDLGALLLRLVIIPKDSGLSRSMNDWADAELARLATLESPELDRVYLEGRVAMNRDVVIAIDRQLLPSATNLDLEAYVIELRPMMLTHLQSARALENRVALR